ncbi:MAG: bifunctional transaldolase/phosoglucose isomerase [Actinobacteria bacterium]|nr:bifunctional transaldolase/phosoglucose isomerase [Actinomycetota bacterium]
MADSALRQLHALGQSVWLDYIRRGLITSGELGRLIQADGIRGITSNPAIFENAIAKSTDYDAALRRLVGAGHAAIGAYEALAIEDIQLAADVLRPVYDDARGADGFVSLEVSPYLAHDTQGTLGEARRLFAAVGRPNTMIKVPATPAGLPAVEQLLVDGINVNITLIFAEAVYAAVAEAYLRALEAHAARGQPLDAVASVASVFVSRIDSAVDAKLGAAMQEHPDRADALRDLLGKAGIANSKLIYHRFQHIFTSARFQRLAAAGARPQRPLWASTSTKNPNYRDVMYVEQLIGPHTVNTMPSATMDAYRDHGEAEANAVTANLDFWLGVLPRLEQAGIRVDEVMQDLQDRGVKLFSDAFDSLLGNLRAKRATLIGASGEGQSVEFGAASGTVVAALESAGAARVAERLWRADASLWTADPGVQRQIADRLGWLRVASSMRAEASALGRWATETARGVRDVVLLGMGGSSLAPEVMRDTIGAAIGRPRLTVLDSTSPEAVARVANSLDWDAALFLVASKSGGTLETATLCDYLWQRYAEQGDPAPGRHFVAITDAGTSLEALARERGFRRTFVNPSDIGGRYSALSYFGLVPAALIGIDVPGLLDRAIALGDRSASQTDVRANPAIALGIAFGALARAGRDKLTLVFSPSLRPLGAWIEQLTAESTGKQGLGIVPVDGETLGAPAVYDHDRLFVEVALAAEVDAGRAAALAALEAAGHPVVRIEVRERLDVGAEFVRWELATAAAGYALGINPFDEPNVAESKANTARLLAEVERTGSLPRVPEGPRAGTLSAPGAPVASVPAALQAWLRAIGPLDYLGIHAYLDMTPPTMAGLRHIQRLLRDGVRRATTLGFGPRFLHSTGQLHKGGANNGVFLQVTTGHALDVAIPGRTYGFATLIDAQAQGDLDSLTSKGRRTLRIHLSDPDAGLVALAGAIETALRAR